VPELSAPLFAAPGPAIFSKSLAAQWGCVEGFDSLIAHSRNPRPSQQVPEEPLMKRFLFAMFLALAVTNWAVGEEFSAILTSVDSDQGTITYQRNVGKRDGPPPPHLTKSVTKDLKVVTVKADTESKKLTESEPLAEGLNADALKAIRQKGIGHRNAGAFITISDSGPDEGKVTKLVIIERKK
jgi:hypothetical protein